MITRLARLLDKAEKLLDMRLQIAEHDLKMRHAYPLPVDFYGPKGTEFRIGDVICGAASSTAITGGRIHQ